MMLSRLLFWRRPSPPAPVLPPEAPDPSPGPRGPFYDIRRDGSVLMVCSTHHTTVIPLESRGRVPRCSTCGEAPR